jgi:hypothetical protein
MMAKMGTRAKIAKSVIGEMLVMKVITTATATMPLLVIT